MREREKKKKKKIKKKKIGIVFFLCINGDIIFVYIFLKIIAYICKTVYKYV